MEIFYRNQYKRVGFNKSTIAAHSVSSSSTVVTICATILTVVVVIAITVIATVSAIVILRKREIVVREWNHLYGTYYHGVEYNVAGDTNQRYNEDGGNAVAVITDQNVYYQF